LRFAWGLGLATACVVLGLVIGQRQGREAAVAEKSLLQNVRVIQEVMAMFPNRVRAIVQDHNGLNVLLADEADVPVSAPLWVKVCRGTDCVSVVTFSGQELEVAGERMTVLADADGGVILTGDRFAWVSTDPRQSPADFKIQARPLQIAFK
jgi:hypothetical protein